MYIWSSERSCEIKFLWQRTRKCLSTLTGAFHMQFFERDMSFAHSFELRIVSHSNIIINAEVDLVPVQQPVQHKPKVQTS